MQEVEGLEESWYILSRKVREAKLSLQVNMICPEQSLYFPNVWREGIMPIQT